MYSVFCFISFTFFALFRGCPFPRASHATVALYVIAALSFTHGVVARAGFRWSPPRTHTLLQNTSPGYHFNRSAGEH